jgi:hypothetical protein
MKRNILITILVIVVFGGYLGYRIYMDETVDVVNRNADVNISADALIAAFEKDSSSAMKTYMDKLVEVTGVVKAVDTSGTVILGSPGMESSIVFSLDRRHLSDHKDLKAGDMVVMQGKCTGARMGEEIMGISLGTTIEFNFAGLKRKNKI